ncbi:1689_t:CDS:2 [Paraglomus brasilianum]|uniref:1689_t:CDS:1 n=1 Tax=Paraglomus brasilianum TaxID=144538 RepID=A0A9N8W4Q9_9GLOM|nr:1689_t:CDS:2 [Paraglomus brasilianum]
MPLSMRKVLLDINWDDTAFDNSDFSTGSSPLMPNEMDVEFEVCTHSVPTNEYGDFNNKYLFVDPQPAQTLFLFYLQQLFAEYLHICMPMETIAPHTSLSSHQPTVSSSTSLSPRTQNLVLSSPPKQKNNQLASSDPIPSIPAKRKSGDKGTHPVPSQKLYLQRYLSIDGDNRYGNSYKRDRRSSAADDKPTPSSSASSSHEVEPKREPHDSSNFDTTIDMKVDGKLISAKSSQKLYKELLTEEEKCANHIASEQKRCNTIRAGFKTYGYYTHAEERQQF